MTYSINKSMMLAASLSYGVNALQLGDWKDMLNPRSALEAANQKLWEMADENAMAMASNETAIRLPGRLPKDQFKRPAFWLDESEKSFNAKDFTGALLNLENAQKSPLSWQTVSAKLLESFHTKHLDFKKFCSDAFVAQGLRSWQNSSQRAREYFDFATKISPANADAWYYSGLSGVVVGQSSALQKAMQLDHPYAEKRLQELNTSNVSDRRAPSDSIWKPFVTSWSRANDGSEKSFSKGALDFWADAHEKNLKRPDLLPLLETKDDDFKLFFADCMMADGFGVWTTGLQKPLNWFKFAAECGSAKGLHYGALYADEEAQAKAEAEVQEQADAAAEKFMEQPVRTRANLAYRLSRKAQAEATKPAETKKKIVKKVKVPKNTVKSEQRQGSSEAVRKLLKKVSKVGKKNRKETDVSSDQLRDPKIKKTGSKKTGSKKAERTKYVAAAVDVPEPQSTKGVVADTEPAKPKMKIVKRIVKKGSKAQK